MLARGGLDIGFHRLPELIEFAGREVAPGAPGDPVQDERSQPDPCQTDHLIADVFHHPAHNAIAPFVDDDPQNGSFRVIPDCAHFTRCYPLAIDRHAAHQLVKRWTRRIAVEKDLVFLLQLISRMRDPVGQFAVIRQQQQTGCRSIQPADRNNALRYINQIKHRSASALILRSRNVSGRLVQENVSLALVPHRLAVDSNRLRIRIDPKPERAHDFTIDRDTPVDDHLFSFPARSDTSCRQNFVQALHTGSFPRQYQAQVLIITVARSQNGNQIEFLAIV